MLADNPPDKTVESVELSKPPQPDVEDPVLNDAIGEVQAFIGTVKTTGSILVDGRFDRRIIAAAAILAKRSESELDRVVRSLKSAVQDKEEVEQWVAAVERHLHGRAVRLTPARDLILRPDPEYLLDGLLEVNSLAMLYAPSGAGKTFVVLSWCFAVAQGVPWLGRDLKRGPVIYVAAEGIGGLAKRLRALMAEHELDAPPEDLYVIEQPVNLFEPNSVREAIAVIEDLGIRPNLIVFDTYARSMAGGDENSAKDVGVVVAALDELRFRLQSAVMVVHHTGKTGTIDRGSSALTGAVDTKIHLGGASVSTLMLTVEKQKNFEAGVPIRLSLEPSGESLVPRASTAPASSPTVGFPASGGGRDRTAEMREQIMTALTEALEAGTLPMTQSSVLGKVKGNADTKARVLHEMAADGTSPVVGQAQGNSIRYSLVPDFVPDSISDDSDSIPPPL